MISETQIKHFQRLCTLAKQLKPKYQTGRTFHVAFAIKKGHLVGIGINDMLKTSPQTSAYTKEDSTNYLPKTHAESDLVKKLNKSNTAKIKIFVVRVNNKGRIALSKPCPNCAHLLGLKSFKEVWYSVNENTFEKL